jgi:hypothetical protein
MSYVEETGKQHNSKQSGLKGVANIDLILMHEHYIPHITFDKTINIISIRTMKLSTLIAMMTQNN